MPYLTLSDLKISLAAKIRSTGDNGLTTAAEMRVFLSDFLDSIFNQINVLQVQIGNAGSGFVHLTGDEIIAGIKTFSAIPLSAGTPTTATQVTNKAYVDAVIAALITTIGTSLPFDSNRLIKRQVIGLEGETLGGSNVNQALEALLFSVKYPGVLLLPIPDRELGNAQAIINYSVVKTDAVITNILINGVPVTPTGDTQSGQVTSTFSGTVDTQVTLTASATKTISVQGQSKVSKACYYGFSPKSGKVTDPILDSDIINLSKVINCPLDRVINKIYSFSSLGYLAIGFFSTDTTNPIFKINGLVNNDFSLSRTSSFINSFGYTYANFKVYISNQQYLGDFQIEIIN